MSKRKTISKRTRFEVFKRDSFKCQYCGNAAPDVVLVIDHIEPVSGGGTNDLINLITACDGCNSGKSDVLLSDDAAVRKQRDQLEALQDRQEQLALLVQWKRSLIGLDAEALGQAALFWSELVPGWNLNDRGRAELGKAIKKHGLAAVLNAMRESTNQYVSFDADGKPTQDSVNKSWEYVQRIARFRESTKDKPYMREVMYIRAICRNTFHYCDLQEAKSLLEQAYLLGYDFEILKQLAQQSRNWTGWKRDMLALLSEAGQP